MPIDIFPLYLLLFLHSTITDNCYPSDTLLIINAGVTATRNTSTDLTIFLSVMDNYNECLNTVISSTPEDGGPFYSITYHNTSFGGCGARDLSWQPVLEIGLNIYSNIVTNSKSFVDNIHFMVYISLVCK